MITTTTTIKLKHSTDYMWFFTGRMKYIKSLTDGTVSVYFQVTKMSRTTLFRTTWFRTKPVGMRIDECTKYVHESFFYINETTIVTCDTED